MIDNSTVESFRSFFSSTSISSRSTSRVSSPRTLRFGSGGFAGFGASIFDDSSMMPSERASRHRWPRMVSSSGANCAQLILDLVLDERGGFARDRQLFVLGRAVKAESLERQKIFPARGERGQPLDLRQDPFVVGQERIGAQHLVERARRIFQPLL